MDATGFYRRLGYEPSGDYYMKEGSEWTVFCESSDRSHSARHLNMVLDLSKTS